MTQEATISSTEISFKDFLFKNKWNRTILWIAAGAIVIQFAIFKYFYPFANFIHGDSFSYINAAEKNLDINTYLIGYSKFLRLFSVFNRTDYALTAFQYFFIQYSALYFLFTLFYFYRSGKIAKIILLGFIVFNPLFLHLGNLISSDGLFLALSLIWFSLLIWIIQKPSLNILIWHALIIFIAFTARYNAMIYPIISLLAIGLSKMYWQRKLASFGLVVLLCGSFVGFTMIKFKNLTGYSQYSPFSGWQLANNAMYAYRYVDSLNRKPVPKEFKVLDDLIRVYYDSTRNTNTVIEKIKASTFYMWSPGLPLMKYRNSLFKNDTTATELKKWASMGPLYKKYGLYIIQQYPSYFFKYFIWPNSMKYYSPPIEFLETYNTGRKGVTEQTKNWFGYKSRNIFIRIKSYKVWILDYYPILSGIINILMLFSILVFLFTKSEIKRWDFNKAALLGVFIWLLNAAFTISASSAALRFQSFPLILTTVLVLVFIDYMLVTVSQQTKAKVNNIQKMEKKLTHQPTI
jgi:hypothetical protein